MSITKHSNSDSDSVEIIDTLDEYSIYILAEASGDAKSAKELSESSGIPKSTIYRRIENLETHGLIEDEMCMGKNGDHYKVYRTQLEHISIEIDNGQIQISVIVEEKPKERLKNSWEKMRDVTQGT